MPKTEEVPFMTKMSRKLQQYALLTLYVLFCLGAVTVRAATYQPATYYVATTGNDSSSGSQLQPFRTIRKGLSTLKAGDKLYIRAGTYSESINSNDQTIPTGTSWADAPLIAGFPGETVTLSYGGIVIGLPHDYIQYLKFENLILDGLMSSDNVICVGTGILKPHHIWFNNVEVKRAGHIGVFFHGNFNIFSGGSVHDVGNTTLYPRIPQGGTNYHYGFYVEGTDNLIEYAEIYNINDFGIHGYSGSSVKSDRNIYRANRLHHTALLSPSMGAILVGVGSGSTAYNNVIYSNKGHGIILMQGAQQATVYNNTAYGNAQSGLWVQSGTSSAIVRNNIAYGNSSGNLYDQGTGTSLSNNLVTDPRFVNPAAFDFSLQLTSPAIDAGFAVSQVTTDIRRNPRPQGGGYDIGAYEAGTQSASLAPPKNLRVQ
jgi:parallel beta-helix repeat protein